MRLYSQQNNGVYLTTDNCC